MLFDTGFYDDATEFYDGGALTDLVPHTYSVALNGIPFMVDYNQPFYRQYRRQMATVIRTQADTSTEPGEQTMDPNGLWRRSANDWSLGAGQRYLDYHDSVDNGFWQSKGIDALTTKWQLTLLPDTDKATEGTGALWVVAASGGLFYATTSQVFVSTNNFSSTTAITGITGTIHSICTDGYTVYVATTSGIWTIAGTATTATQYLTVTLTAPMVGFANGRLMLADGASVYNITATGSSLPTALFTAVTGWSAASSGSQMFANGNTNLYFGMNSGYSGVIYGSSVSTDGTTLEPPTAQAFLPEGETVTALYGYLGNLIVGTSLGVRFCETNSAGGITLGSLIPTPNPVYCLTGWKQFVYFGWTDYDTESTGLGYMNLENFAVSGLQPAFASYLMAGDSSNGVQGTVTSVVPNGGTAVFVVENAGIYVQSVNLVPTGYIDSGLILYDLSDTKIPTLLDCRTDGPLTAGSYDAYLAVDEGSFVPVGSHGVGDPEPVSFGLQTAGVRFELRIVLNGDADEGPVFGNWLLRSYPAPVRPLTWQLPLLINEELVTMSGSSAGFDTLSKLQALEAMVNSRSLVTFQEGENQYAVFVSDCAFLPDYTTENGEFFNGVALITLLGIPANS